MILTYAWDALRLPAIWGRSDGGDAPTYGGEAQLFPVVGSAVVMLNLAPDIWLNLLMILGTQWYILINSIVGASLRGACSW
jgi:hypothetical protein